MKAIGTYFFESLAKCQKRLTKKSVAKVAAIQVSENILDELQPNSQS